MSVQHANRGIVKKDLQLYYNREFQKSFRGEATSNLIMNANDANYYQGLYNFTVTPNAEIAPDGSNNAWSLAWNGTDFNYYSKNFPISNSTVYTTSVFAKAGTHNVIWVGIGNMSGGENNASFNLTTGVATNGSPASTSCSMVYYGNGWWRCITTNTSGTSGATTSAMTVSIGSGRASLGTVYFWGFQAEKKSYATLFLDPLNPIRNQVATNLYSPYSYDGFWFVNTYNYVGSTGATLSVVSGILNPINSATVLKYNTASGGYIYFALSKAGLASGTYTVSYYARLESGGPTNLNNSQIWRDNVTDRGVDGDWNPTFYTYWRRFRTTASVTSGTLHFFPIHSGSITGGYTVYYTGFQLESGSEPTSFAPSAISTANTIASNGGLIDLSGNNNNADLANVSFNSNGFTFGGSANYIDLPSTTFLDFNLNNFSIFTWIKSSATANFGNIFNNMNTAGTLGVQFLTQPSNGGCRVWIADLAHNNTVNVTNGSWNYVGFVRDGDYVYFYVNGFLSSTGTGFAAKNATPNSGNDRRIGRQTTNTGYDFNGQISNFKIYSKALTAAEVLQNFNATRKTYGI